MPYYNASRTATQPVPTKRCTPSPCPACGGLECLCRPRFFAGQLLTEEDLNRLENYIIEKNKLHNRYLFGWGVVCGLEVICSPCEGQVTVTPGYALSPCGEDIVVCHNDVVSVCDMITACKQKGRQQCDDYGSPYTGSRNAQPEQWILAIRYDEKPSKGVTPLKNGQTCACSCSRCSGSSSSGCGSPSCSCGCGSTTNGTMKNGQKTAYKSVPPQCEPTVICEGYVYEVYKAPPASSGQDCGPFIDRFAECMYEFMALLQAFGNISNNSVQLVVANRSDILRLSAWLRSLQSSLRNLLDNLPVYDCLLAEQLGKVDLPNASIEDMNTFASAFATATNRLLAIGDEILRFCLCSAILPPCPNVVHDPYVPLATITLSNNPDTGACQLVQVCNLDTRTMVATIPNLLYWLSAFFPFLNLHQLLKSLCCNPSEGLFRAVGVRENQLFAMPAETEAAAVIIIDCVQILQQLLANLFSNRTVNTATVMLSALGIRDVQGAAVMSDVELKNPGASLLLNQLVRPLLRSMLPEPALRTFAAAPPVSETPAPGAPAAEEINRLQTQITELQDALKQQQGIINQLLNR